MSRCPSRDRSLPRALFVVALVAEPASAAPPPPVAAKPSGPAATGPTAAKPAAAKPAAPRPAAKSASTVPAPREPEALPPAESTPEREEAAKRFKLALQLYGEGAFDAARAELHRAYELAPTYRIFYNLGLVHLQLGDHAAALDAFERYLAEGGAEVPDARKKEVDQEIARLTERVGFLDVSMDVPNAELWIDDVPLARGADPLRERVRVTAGRRRVTAAHEGKRVVMAADVASQTEVPLRLVLEETEKAPPPAPPPAPLVERSPLAPWVSWGVTGGLSLVSIAFGTGALIVGNDGSTDPDDAAARANRDAWAVATGILGVATLVSAGAATFFTIRELRTAAPKTSVSVLLSPSTVGARLRF